jgi:hypothetical protein
MKTRWKILAGVAVAGFGFAAWVQADLREWDLGMHLPTPSIKESKQLRVFVRRLEVEPREINFGGRRYQIGDVWLEHRSEPLRLSFFYTRQEILPELVLCVDITPFDMQADVCIKDARRTHILVSGVNGVLFSEVGLRAPKIFTLCTRDRQSEISIRVKEESIQAPQPTKS